MVELQMLIKTMGKAFLGIALLLAATGCEEYETVVIPDNTAPPDETVETYVIENYVHKIYIALLGRDAEEAELQTAVDALRTSNFSLESRENALNSIMDRDEYAEKMFDIVRIELLNNLDTGEVSFWIGMFESVLNDPGQSNYWAYAQYEVDRLYAFDNALPQWIAGQAEMKQVYAASVNNMFYDEINMGTENFVVAVFQNMLSRYPTESELENSKRMVEGISSTLFFQTGNSKADFVEIFYDSDNYYEGRVKYLFSKYLFREPTSEELLYYTGLYKNSDNFRSLHRTIFASDEYAGL